MKSLEPLAITCITDFQKYFYEERAAQQAASLLHTDITWVLTRDITLHGKQAAAAFLESRAATMQEPFTVYQTAYSATQLNDTDCQISGAMTLVYSSAGTSVVTPSGISALCRMEDGAMRILYMHVFTQETAIDAPAMQAEALREVVTKRVSDIRRKQREAVISNEAGYKEILMNMPGGLFTYSAEEDAQFDFINQAVLDIFGYSEEDFRRVYENKFDNIIHPEDREWVLASIDEQIQDGPFDEVRYRILDASGSVRYVHDVGRIITDASGRRMFFVVVIDITQYVLSERALATSEKRMRAIVEQSSDIIFEYDLQTDRAVFHSDFERVFGRLPMTDNVRSGLISASGIIYPDDEPALAAFFTSLHAGDSYADTEARLRTGDGTYVWCHISASIVYDDYGKPYVAMGKIADIDKQKRETESLKTKANTDPMTGLYNKAVSAQMLSEFISGEGKKGVHALFMIDVDDFKSINDNNGHLFGDTVLISIAHVLSKSFRSSDIVGRIGGDEFMALMKHVGSKTQLEKRAQSILQAVQSLFTSPGQTVSCTIGVALFPDHGGDLSLLYHNADIALYHAKNTGKGRYCIYNAELGRAFRETASQMPERTAMDDPAAKSIFNAPVLQELLTLLMKASDYPHSLQNAMALLGEYFQVSRSYIFELSEEGTAISNTFEWCRPGIPAQKDALQNLQIPSSANYFANFDENGVFYCRDIHALPAWQTEVLEPQQIKAMLQCLLRDGDKLHGFIGFDECEEARAWSQAELDIVTYAAHALSVFITWQHSHAPQSSASEQMGAMLEALQKFSAD